MANDIVGVYNLALSAVGTRSSVSSPDENSREAELCTLWYDIVRDMVLRAAPWPSARAVRRLALTAERDPNDPWAAGAPEPPWRFAYAYPSDMIRPRYLDGFERFATGLTGSQRTILTDVDQAILVYTRRQETVSAWDSGLKMAIIYGLAAHISMPLHGKVDRMRNALELANEFILDARVAAANQDNAQYESVPEWIAARGYGEAVGAPRYIYPSGPTLSLAGFSTGDKA